MFWKYFRFTLWLEGGRSKNHLNSTANYTLSQVCCWPLEKATFLPWLDPVRRGKEERKRRLRIANAFHKEWLSYLPPPPPPPAYVATVTIKLQMEAKFNPTLRPVFLTCVGRGFPRDFQRNWKGKTIITENVEQCAIFCTKSLNIPSRPESTHRDMLTSTWSLKFYVPTHRKVFLTNK